MREKNSDLSLLTYENNYKKYIKNLFAFQEAPEPLTNYMDVS